MRFGGVRLMLIVVLAGILSAPAAKADETAKADVLTALASATFAAREAASSALLQDDAVDVSKLRELFAQAREPEQQHRLLTVAMHHLVRQLAQARTLANEPGSLGLVHQTVQAGAVAGLEQPAVQVLTTLPGFPAYAHLQVGDLILAVDGQAFTEDITAEMFRDAIKGKQAGERIHLTLLREGKQMDTQFKLGSLLALQSIYDPANMSLREQYAQQWASLRDELLALVPAPVALTVSEADLANDAVSLHQPAAE